MKKSFAIGAVTVAALFSLGLVACGSDDDSGDAPSDDTLTKTELVAKADEICTEGNEELREVTENAFEAEPTDEEVSALISEEVVPHYESELEELRALEPDEASSAAWNDVLDKFEAELQVVKDDPDAAVDVGDPFPESSAAAEDFGLEVCGQS